jgi:hypothetical protein
LIAFLYGFASRKIITLAWGTGGSNFTMDPSCTYDPDYTAGMNVSNPALLNPITYSFECYRFCESAPQHTSDGTFTFIPWGTAGANYTTSCASSDPLTHETQSTEGCFRVTNFHISGPLTEYPLNAWTSFNYPLDNSSEINQVALLHSFY